MVDVEVVEVDVEVAEVVVEEPVAGLVVVEPAAPDGSALETMRPSPRKMAARRAESLRELFTRSTVGRVLHETHELVYLRQIRWILI